MNIWNYMTVRFLKMCCIGLGAVGLLALTSGCRGVAEDEVQVREMIAAGRASFRAYCAGCHGKEGKGDGPAVEYMTVPPADLTQVTKRHGQFPEEAIYERIDGSDVVDDNESKNMPHWGNIWRGMNPDWESPQDIRERIDELVAFIKSIQDTSA